MKIFRFIALLLLVVGSLNWGLWGLFQYNLVEDLFKNAPAMARLIYGLVGIAGLWGITLFFVPCIYSSKCSCKK
jgi:uncharacterized protein